MPARIEALGGDARVRSHRLLEARAVEGWTDPPEALHGWLEATFGSVDAVRHQSLVRITNLATFDATIFAPLRSRRPVDGPVPGADLAAEIASTRGDPFCNPVSGTPAESFGRVRGARMVTGANAALADAHHAVLVFDEHDPLAFDDALVRDLLSTGRDWAERSQATDPAATMYLLIWNCLWRAGGSIVHGHAQALLGTGAHYSAVERFRRDMASHRQRHGFGLVDDLVAVHDALGLVDWRDGIATIAILTPLKEREVMIVAPPGRDERDPSIAGAVARALLAYRDRLGVRSFNLALWRPPLAAGLGGWEEFPTVVRLVDRGDPAVRPSDIGAMELFGTPIVGSDPYDVIGAVRAT